MNLKIFFILFLYLIFEEIEVKGGNVPTKFVAPNSNVGEIAPASYGNDNGVEYSNIPFFGNTKISEGQKGSQNGKKKSKGEKTKVDPANRFSVLQGLTEEKQTEMFDKVENKSESEEKKEECEEECVEKEDCKDECVDEVVIDTSQLNMHKSRSATTNRKLLQKELNRPSRREDNPRFDDRSNNCCCCCPSWVRVVVVGALTFSGATLSQFGNVMDCKISPDFGINRNLPSCVKINDVISCNSNYFLWGHSKQFHKYLKKNETFELYCPVGKNNKTMTSVAEAVVTRVKDKTKRKWTLTFVQKNDG